MSSSSSSRAARDINPFSTLDDTDEEAGAAPRAASPRAASPRATADPAIAASPVSPASPVAPSHHGYRDHR